MKGQETMRRREPWQMTREEVWRFAQPENVMPVGGFKVYLEDGVRRFRTWKQAANWLDKEHRAWVRQAIYEGKTVPSEVLADYPDIGRVSATRINPREPWQMTLRSFATLERGKFDKWWYHGPGSDRRQPGGPDLVSFGEDVRSDHSISVRNAILDGERVPPEVLADYPEFRRLTRKIKRRR